jgi:hypothetical protein
MRARRHLWIPAALALVVAGCGSSGGKSGVSDANIVDALHLDSTAGSYTIHGTLCGVSKLLHTADEVSKADSANPGRVLASKDASVGIVILPPFAKSCEKDARKGLNSLTKGK